MKTQEMTHAIERDQDWYRTHFDVLEKGLNGEATTELHTIRRAAFAHFLATGFPTTRDEEWRFTNVLPIAKSRFNRATAQSIPSLNNNDVERFTPVGLNAHRLVFVNGVYAATLSDLAAIPVGATVSNLAEAISANPEIVGKPLTRYARFDESAFTALNTAFLHDGAFVHIPDGMILEKPIHIIFVSTGDPDGFTAHPRNLIVVGNNSQVSLLESYVSLAKTPYFMNAVSEIVLGENAVVEHDKLQDESEAAFHVGTIHVHQHRRSNFTSNSIALGGALVRNNVTVVLDDEGCESTLNGLSLAMHQQLVDNHTTIDHAKPHCNSHELYKSILDGKSRGVFNGKIFVRKDAQKTDAKQTNKTLLLSDDATIDTKPQLEIFADDVKCTHGATVGQLDEEQVFYLRSRGLSNSEARDILTFAFASDVVHRVHIEPLREQLDAMIQSRLRKGRENGAY
ncbi:MAG: Fe-S cluster assembly protein SufD [Bacteroidota bacterium]